jgi:choline-sulfatase
VRAVTEARPDILLIMADQLPAAALPAYGHPVVHAPHLSRLAARGAVFDAAYCASPLCAPSRFAMLTGQPPSAIEAFDNAAELPAATPTVTHLLRAAGYRTVLSGKMHFVGPDQLHGFERRLTTDVYPAGFDWTPDWRSTERAGWYHSARDLRAAAVREAALQTDFDDEAGFRAVQELRHHAATAGDQPLFLVASFTNPHDPWEVRRAHWDRYADAEIPAPAVPTLPLDEADPHSRRLRAMYGAEADPLDASELPRVRRAYFAAISYLDDRVGELLDTLEATGRADRTLVLFTSDHGEMLGERGLWFKMSFFDGSARVPLIAAGPGIAPQRVAEPVSQLDLAPTLTALAGAADADVPLVGTSLWPRLTGAGPAPDAVVAEYLAEGVHAPAVMLRRGRHKLIRCPGDPDQLYDLAADPHELRNLADDPMNAQVADALGAEVDARWDLDALHARVLASQARRRVVARALATGEYTPWDHQPSVDASRQYVRGPAAFGRRPGERYPFAGALTDDA